MTDEDRQQIFIVRAHGFYLLSETSGDVDVTKGFANSAERPNRSPPGSYFSSKTYARGVPSMASSVCTLPRLEYVAVNFVCVLTAGGPSRGVARSLPPSIHTATASRT